MFGEHHNLAGEFPEYKEKIHDLKINNPNFARLFDQYENIDKEIYRIEEQIQNTSDDYMEGLKIKRVKLKDELYAMLKQA